MLIKQYLKKNEMIYYLGVAWKKRKDTKFRRKFFKFYDTPDALLFEHLGTENSDRNIYLIYTDNNMRGFFSLFNLVLDGLEFAEYYHLTPVIEFGENTIYHEKNGIDGVMNSFEYYFKEPSEISLESAHHSKNVVFYEPPHRKLAIPDFYCTVGASLTDDDKMKEYLNRRAQTIKKYIRFSDNAQKYLDDTVGSLISGEKTLGVHVRGTDMNAGYNGHAKVVLPTEYLETAKQVFKTGDFKQVFLATDETAVIKLFEEFFGDRLVYFRDSLRSDNGKALHFSQSKREHHKYKLGLEVLRDMYALSLCDGLIAGISNVSLSARMMKKSFNKEYENMVILSHGFNQTNITMGKKYKQ